MKLPYIFEKCILCMENPADSYEHIIPKSIGGNFEVKMLCKRCNNTTGTELISKIKEDPRIRYVLQHLKGDTPSLFQKMENSQKYEVKDNAGNRILMKNKDSKLYIQPHRKDDDTFIFDPRIHFEKHKEYFEKRWAL